MTQYGAVHELVVEYENQGIVDDEQEPASDVYLIEVRYIVRHPEDCWPDWKTSYGGEKGDSCPITMEIQNVGLEDALVLSHWRNRRTIIEHLPEGLYDLWAWSERHSGPDGVDYSGGLDYERKEPEKKEPEPRPEFKLVPFETNAPHPCQPPGGFGREGES